MKQHRQKSPVIQTFPRFRKGKHVEKSLKEVSQLSDIVLTVSYPLMRQLSAWCDPILFLPWADADYVKPSPNKNRLSVLIWASINNVIDYDLLLKTSANLPGVEFHLVGPLSPDSIGSVDTLTKLCSNVKYFPPCNLDCLDLSVYFAGLMPYKAKVATTEAVTLANKSLRLMSRGLPLVVHGMPDFFDHPAIYKCENEEDLSLRLTEVSEKFWCFQDSIENFVKENTAENRYRQFFDIIMRGK